MHHVIFEVNNDHEFMGNCEIDFVVSLYRNRDTFIFRQVALNNKKNILFFSNSSWDRILLHGSINRFTNTHFGDLKTAFHFISWLFLSSINRCWCCRLFIQWLNYSLMYANITAAEFMHTFFFYYPLHWHTS